MCNRVEWRMGESTARRCNCWLPHSPFPTSHSPFASLMFRLSIVTICLVAATSAGARSPDFQDDILPLLKNRCVRCHGPTEKKAVLNLALPPGIARGGENGTVIVPGKPE